MTDEETLKEVNGLLGATNNDAPSIVRRILQERQRYQWFALNTLAVAELEETTLCSTEKIRFIQESWQKLKEASQEYSQAEHFVQHIKQHLATTPELAGQSVICKICGKTIDEISKEETN
jgi:hypothetical protein